MKSIDEEGLIKAYVGEEYDKLKVDKFNWLAFLFPVFSLAYRKQLAYAISVLLLLFISGSINILAAFLIKLIIGINFNKIYIWIVKRRVNSIKEETKNDNELIAEIKKQSGKSIKHCLLVILVFAIIIAMKYIPILLQIAGGYYSLKEFIQTSGYTYLEYFLYHIIIRLLCL